MCHAFQAQVFSHKDSALLYGDGECFNAMVGITRSKVILCNNISYVGIQRLIVCAYITKIPGTDPSSTSVEIYRAYIC